MTGLSDASFMGGAMQGFAYGENMKANWKQQEHNNKRMGMAEENHDLSTAAARKKAQVEDLTVRIRAGIESGVAPGKDFWKAANGSGLDYLRDPNYRQKRIGNSKKIQAAIDKDEFGPELQESISELLEDSLAKRDWKDGFKREDLRLRKMPNGKLGMEVSVTNPEGKKYRAPLTKQGGTGKDEQIIQLDRQVMSEWGKAGIAQGQAAQFFEDAGNDPRKQWSAMYKVLTGEDYTSPKKAPGLNSIYDKKSGLEQKVAWNGERYVPVGGTKAPAQLKDGKGGSKSGGGNSDNNKNFIKAIENYQADYASAIESGDPEALEQVKALHQKTTGLDFDLVAKATAFKRERHQDFSPLTYEEFNQFNQSTNTANARVEVDHLVNTDEELFGSDKPAAKSELASAPSPQTSVEQVVAQRQGLSDSAGFRGMPNLSGEQSQQAAAIRQSKTQAKEQLMAELQSIRSSLGKTGRRTPTKREASLLAAMREIDGSYDMETLNQAIAKIKLGSGSQKPGINDSAHMAAL